MIGRRARRWAMLTATLWLLPQVAAAADGRGLVGRWRTEDRRAIIAIAPCGAALCGTIAAVVIDPPGSPLPRDFRNQPQCGFALINSIARDGEDGWTARITDPRDGRVYPARLRIDAEGRLRVRGYLGIPLFGQTQVWTPFAGRVPEDCRLPPLRG